jgi:hypothetical protein
VTLVVLEHNHIRAIKHEKLTNVPDALEVLLRATGALHAPVDQ